MADFTVSYAQNREDIILSGFFKDLEKGFYVDVGANHPEILSITKHFYDKGWNGINVEPNAHLFKLLKQQRTRDINLNIGAADKLAVLTLREYPEGDGLSTFSKETQNDYQNTTSVYRKNTQKYEDHEVSVKPLNIIFEENKVSTINFMSIDVEGFEYEVIKGNDWNKYRPQVLCIEANHIVKDWRPLLLEANYSLVFFDGLNNYYVADENKAIAKQFSYVETVLLKNEIIPAAFHKRLVELQTQLSQLDNKLVRQNLVEENLRAEIHQLHSQQIANRRLRSLLKQLISGLNAAVLTQIEKLNKPKIKSLSDLKIDEDLEINDILLKIKQYDVKQYYNSKNKTPMRYKIIHGTYTTVYEALKAAARKLVKLLRGLK